MNAAKFNELRTKILRYNAIGELQLRTGIDVTEYIHQCYPLQTFPLEFINQVQKMTQGHPLFLNQLFSLWQDTRVIKAIPNSNKEFIWSLQENVKIGSMIPPTIQAVLEQRLKLTGEELRQITISASVEGEEFTDQVLAHLSKIEESKVYDFLESLEHRYWLIQEYTTYELGETI